MFNNVYLSLLYQITIKLQTMNTTETIFAIFELTAFTLFIGLLIKAVLTNIKIN